MIASQHPLSVLVVDDYPDTAKSTADLLALVGYSARVALGGEEALVAADADPPDVILLDVRMPGLDGCELARRLTSRGVRKTPVLVAVTGCGAEDDRVRTAAAGFQLHLVKPVAPAVLVGVMAQFRETLEPKPVEGSRGLSPRLAVSEP